MVNYGCILNCEEKAKKSCPIRFLGATENVWYSVAPEKSFKKTKRTTPFLQIEDFEASQIFYEIVPTAF